MVNSKTNTSTQTMEPTIGKNYYRALPVLQLEVLTDACSLLEKMERILESKRDYIDTLSDSREAKVWDTARTEVTLEDWRALMQIMKARINEAEQRVSWIGRMIIKANTLAQHAFPPRAKKLVLHIGDDPSESARILPHPKPDSTIVNGLLQAEAIRAFELPDKERVDFIERSMLLSEVDTVRSAAQVRLICGSKLKFPLELAGTLPLFDRPEVFHPLHFPSTPRIPNPWKGRKPDPKYTFKME